MVVDIVILGKQARSFAGASGEHFFQQGMLEQAGPLLRVEIIPDSQLGKRQKAERELISNLPALFLLN